MDDMYVQEEKLIQLYRSMETEALATHAQSGKLTKEAQQLALTELHSRGFSFESPVGQTTVPERGECVDQHAKRRPRIVQALIVAIIAAAGGLVCQFLWRNHSAGAPSAVPGEVIWPKLSGELDPERMLPTVTGGLVAVARLNDGSLLWRDHDSIYGNRPTLTAVRWNPTTGATFILSLPQRFRHPAVTDFGTGLLFAGGTTSEKSGSTVSTVAWVRPNGRMKTAQLHAPRARPRLIRLADQSILVVGGVGEWESSSHEHFPSIKTYSLAVDRVTQVGDELRTERLPDVPGPVRSGYAVVEMADGRVMVLGGDSGTYLGCSQCIPNTYVLDMQNREWRPGPPMLEARAFGSASLLPDGSVLVAGGWTRQNDWQKGPSRSVERLASGAENFVVEAPLLSGVARHEAVWAAGETGRQLLMLGGSTASIQAYDVTEKVWRMVGETCGRYQAGVVAPFLYQGRPYVWLFDRGDGGANSPYCDKRVSSVARVALRMRPPSEAHPEYRVDSKLGIALFRGQMSFLPAAEGSPAVALGGTVPSEPGEVLATAVDVLFPDGIIKSAASLPAPLRGEPVFRLKDKSVLFPKSGYWIAERDLLATNGRWTAVPESVGAATSVGQAEARSLIVLTEGLYVDRITFSVSPEGVPISERVSVSPLINERQPDGDGSQVVIRGVTGGRIVVAGGTVKVYNEDSGLADFVPYPNYEIYDPKTNAWRESAPSTGSSSMAAILDDGRVVKAGEDGINLLVSNVEGTTWTTLAAKQPVEVRLDRDARLFVINGELFLSGRSLKANNDGPTILQWFNAEAHSWTTLWEADPEANWRFNVGRIIVRSLVNGKTVVVPIAGP